MAANKNVSEKIYEYESSIYRAGDTGGAYVIFPYNIREEFGRGRVKVSVTFDGVPYEGSIVNMGVKNEDGSVCYIIGLRKDIRSQIGKQPGDNVWVTVKEKNPEILSGTEKKGAWNMWKCPQCGREFKRQNQSHYCGKAPENIDGYIAAQPGEQRRYLQLVRDAVHEAIPEAEERISWSMPTFWKKHNIIQFAGFKNHIGLYPGPEAVEAFSQRLQGYKTSKGTIQIPYGEEIPLELIGDIARWCYETGNHP